MRKEVFSYINSAVTWLHFIGVDACTALCLESIKTEISQYLIDTINQEFIGYISYRLHIHIPTIFHMTDDKLICLQRII